MVTTLGPDQQGPEQHGHAQHEHGVRFEWGPTGGRAVASKADLAVVVDVLCFSTAVGVAVERGSLVVPHPADADDAEEAAAQLGAVLVAPPSPSGLLAAEVAPRVLLSSPDGARVSRALSGLATTVVAASLRNAAAVADWIAREHDDDAVVAVVAAGGRWPDGSLRPAVEDLWGAGAVLAALEDHDWPGLSPEAATAADAYRLVAGREASHLGACATGRELAAAGRTADVELAARTSVSTVVPVLSDRGFVPAP